jgi:alanyl-tRNA synthetase
MTSDQIRRSFLEYFAKQRHRVVPSSPLVPTEDPTLLFTNAGMNQFKDLFLGREKRDYARAASSQKCMRVSGKHNDLENVGPSLRHHTFFEMLGNFSFGDYFKREAIGFAWELLTDVWKLPPDRLRATVFCGEGGIPRDAQAYDLWREFLPSDQIGELGLADNFWAMGETGPCGRCSEVHYFRGNHVPCPEPECRGLDCDCDRYVEIWNVVFMEFERQPDLSLVPLPAPSIDTGMGLERVSAILQDRLSNYDTDLFRPLLDAISSLSGRAYGGKDATDAVDVSMRVVADHARATTFLVADGVVPSNEWRGYVLRKIMRRAMRHGNRLGLTEPFLSTLVDVLVQQMGDAYPELRRGRDYVVQVVRSEEERFAAVLSTGLPRLEELVELHERAGLPDVAGDEVFRLYDSYGLPVDFIEDVAGQRGLGIDREGFDRAMEAQRERARAGSAFSAGKADEFTFRSDQSRRALEAAGDRFEGYTDTSLAGVSVLGVFDETRNQVAQLGVGTTGWLALERTPFYLESGGQVSDIGRIAGVAGDTLAVVEGMARLGPGLPRLHRVRIETGTIAEGDLVSAEVASELRDATRRNHTATHLLHAALRGVLGSHVKQAGSLVAPDRFRFDFVHFTQLTRDQVERIEDIVNAQIRLNAPVRTEERPTEEAMAAGAMALFGEKYGDRVRVVAVPGVSMELCGGTHCRSTGDIGFFTIVQETGIAAGVRRIEGLTGDGAVRHYQERRRTLESVLAALNVPESQAADSLQRLQTEVKRLTREVSQLKVKAAMSSQGPSPSGPARDEEEAVDVDGVGLLRRRLEDLDKSALRDVADSLKARLRSGVVILGAVSAGKVTLVVSVTPDLAGRVHAGQMVRRLAPIVGGGGGGRADFAEAGGKHPERLDALFEESKNVLREMLQA